MHNRRTRAAGRRRRGCAVDGVGARATVVTRIGAAVVVARHRRRRFALVARLRWPRGRSGATLLQRDGQFICSLAMDAGRRQRRCR